jgi:UDP-GlcNAc:undecaprenyl-phosphate GlcNAc-1-phosphate transferase
MDNLDGAAATVAGVSSAGIGALAALAGNPGLAAVSLAVSGACLGFLPHNLAGPARIFLGDGGSMPLGLLVAGTAMSALEDLTLGLPSVLVAAMIVGLAIFDTTLVVVSRTRDQVPLVQAGRDHLTHRLLARLRSPRRVALTLGVTQGALCALAVLSAESGALTASAVAAVCAALGVVALVRLDSPSWRPSRLHSDGSPSPAGPVFDTLVETPQPSRVKAT